MGVLIIRMTMARIGREHAPLRWAHIACGGSLAYVIFVSTSAYHRYGNGADWARARVPTGAEMVWGGSSWFVIGRRGMGEGFIGVQVAGVCGKRCSMFRGKC